jgi:CheY-like chemotaxis protein
MAAQSLVLCRDPDVLRALCPLLFEINMGVEICLGTNGATRMLRKRRFDAVIVECASDGTGLDVLQELRADTPNQHTIAVGVVDDPKSMQAAFATGANFVLSKPISIEDASRILRFTSGLLGRMVRRFLRVAVHHLAHVDLVGLKDPAFILDLSEGGMAMQSLAPMSEGQSLDLSFLLPGSGTRLEATATIVWSDPTGRIGLEFTQLSDEHRALLKNWVRERLRKSPEDVPGGTISAPPQVRVLSKYMRPLARVIDGAVVVSAAALFCMIALWFLGADTRESISFSTAYLVALLVGTGLYASLFMILDVRFPGTRAVQGLLEVANSRETA